MRHVGRLGRVRDHVAPSAAAANTAVIAETEELPNGTRVIRFEADRPLLESARGMPEDEPPSDDDGEPEGPQRLHEITLVTERSSEEIERRLRQIRIDRFRTVLAPAMRDHGIGMFIYVLRLGRETVPGSDNQFAGEFGANCGVFVFTDRGEEEAGLEAAAFDHTDRPVESLGAYDKVFKPSTRMTLDEISRNYGHEETGIGRGTELDWRVSAAAPFASPSEASENAVHSSRGSARTCGRSSPRSSPSTIGRNWAARSSTSRACETTASR